MMTRMLLVMMMMESWWCDPIHPQRAVPLWNNCPRHCASPRGTSRSGRGWGRASVYFVSSEFGRDAMPRNKVGRCQEIFYHVKVSSEMRRQGVIQERCQEGFVELSRTSVHLPTRRQHRWEVRCQPGEVRECFVWTSRRSPLQERRCLMWRWEESRSSWRMATHPLWWSRLPSLTLAHSQGSQTQRRLGRDKHTIQFSLACKDTPLCSS